MAVFTPDSIDALDKTAIEAAKSFTDWYYHQLSHDKTKVAHAYTTNSPSYKAIGQTSDIVIGGSRLAQPEDLEWALAMQRRTYNTTSAPGSAPGLGLAAAAAPPTAAATTTTTDPATAATAATTTDRVTYALESLDVHVGNPNYVAGASPDALAATAGPNERLMLLVFVDGVVTFGAAADAPRATFAESFVLVPNWEAFEQRRSNIAAGGGGGGGSAPPPPKGAKRWLILAQNFRRRG